MGNWQFQYLQVHLFEADEHPGDEALPKAGRNKAHLHKALQGVVSPLAEAMDVHGWLVGKKVGQQIATAKERNTGDYIENEDTSCMLAALSGFCLVSGLLSHYLLLYIF